MKHFPLCPAVGLALFLAGCTVGPRYTPPQSNLAPEYSSAPTDQAGRTTQIVAGPEATARWWFVFGDPELNSLIARAARNNLDLQEALSRVRLARAERAGLTSRLWPEVDASAGYDRGHGSENVVLPFGSASTGAGGASSKGVSAETTGSDPSQSGGGAAAGQPLSPFGQGGLPGVTTNLYQVGFDASWEIDIFGGTRRALEAAGAGVAAAEEARRAALASLLAEVATTYVELRTDQHRLQITREHLAAQKEELAIIEAKFKTGFATDLEVAQQNAQLAATQATLPPLETIERTSAHALAFLLAEPPAALTAELDLPKALPPLPAAVPVGMPSDLLRRRPDIRRAERELDQATAQVGVAAAELLPKFDLTGAFGLDSSDLRHLPEWSSHYYSISPGIRWPILDWGRIRANVHVQTERQQQAFLEYQKTVAQALRDVEDALVQYGNEQSRRTALAAATDASRRARELAGQRFEHGVSDLLATLDAQRTLLQAEDALAQSDGALRRDLISLYKALGGGWEE